MPRNSNYYSQAEHSVVISALDGSFRRVITDFAEGDDAIAAEPLGDRVALTEGFDKTALSFSAFRGGQVTLKLKPTSPEVGFINNLFNTQSSSPTPVNITISTGVRDVVTLQNAGVSPESFSTGGPTMQPRGYKFLGAEMKLDENEGGDSA